MSGLVKTAPESLRKVSAAEWRRRILDLPAHVRKSVARVTWWEFFGDLPRSQRPAELADLIGSTGEAAPVIPDNDLLAGLLAIGWPLARARAKVQPPTYTQGGGTARPGGVSRLRGPRTERGDDQDRPPREPKARRRKGEVRHFLKFKKRKGWKG
jgi:hypothetical protein